MRNLVISTVLGLDSRSMGSLDIGTTGARNDFKGQPLSAVQVRLGFPDQQETIAGQKVYTWFKGQSLTPCKIRVVAAGEVVDSYETMGDAGICSPYDYRPG
jgi:hypothetical protein